MAKRKLILENGKVFWGEGFGDTCKVVGEVMFHTSITGYQEMITDPTNHGRIMVATYPLVGNYGCTEDDSQSQSVHVAGLVVSEHNENPSNFRFTSTLGEVMEINRTVGISGVDTRSLTKILVQAKKPLLGMIVDATVDDLKCIEELNSLVYSSNEVPSVSCKRVMYMRTRNPKYTVVIVDTGVRTTILRELNSLSCNLVVVPYNTSIATIMKHKPDGIIFPNGPGNPESNLSVIELAKKLRGEIPILGIGLGFQIICLSYGGKVKRLPYGVSGSNIPVHDIVRDKILITSQNNCYEVGSESLKGAEVTITHKNVMTNGIEGIEDVRNKVIAVQFEPNATGDGTGALILYNFLENMKQYGGANHAEENRY